MPAKQVAAHGLCFQTLGYRAPEVHWGFQGFSEPVDLFSLGCVLQELAGSPAFALPRGARDPEWDNSIALVTQLGLPSGRPMDAWPTFPKKLPKCPRDRPSPVRNGFMMSVRVHVDEPPKTKCSGVAMFLSTGGLIAETSSVSMPDFLVRFGEYRSRQPRSR